MQVEGRIRRKKMMKEPIELEEMEQINSHLCKGFKSILRMYCHAVSQGVSWVDRAAKVDGEDQWGVPPARPPDSGSYILENENAKKL